MSDYYKVQIETVYLTRDGLVAGQQCRIDVDGVDKLQTDYEQNDFTDFRGNPIVQLTDVGTKGKPVTLNITKVPQSVLSSIIAINEAAKANQTLVTVTGTDDYRPDFTRECVPAKNDVEFKDRDTQGNYVRVTLRYRTAD